MCTDTFSEDHTTHLPGSHTESNQGAAAVIENVYFDIVNSLNLATEMCIPSASVSVSKHWWDPSLDIFKKMQCYQIQLG